MGWRGVWFACDFRAARDLLKVAPEVHNIAMISEFQTAAVLLTREAFEGRAEGENYTWFVEDREALLPSMDELSAEQVSWELRPGVATIGAHFNHILFALRNVNGAIRGERPEGTWESSWERQTFSPGEWDDLKNNVKSEYEFFIRAFESNEDWPNMEHVIGGLGVLPHMAFHLGAIRQIMKFL